MLPQSKIVETSCLKKSKNNIRDNAGLISNVAKKAKTAFFIAHESVKLEYKF